MIILRHKFRVGSLLRVYTSHFLVFISLFGCPDADVATLDWHVTEEEESFPKIRERFGWKSIITKYFSLQDDVEQKKTEKIL